MKKILASALAFLLLSACGTPSASQTQSPAQPPDPTEDPALAASPTPLVLSTPMPYNDWRLETKGVGYEYDIDALTYELVWSDEFDYVGEPDPEKWGYDLGGGGWGNNELQCYTKENATVDGEKLIIEARKEEKGGNDYTSSRVISKNKGDWLYGRIEINAKLPAGLGTWPAIWMLPTDWDYGNWPDSGEIDIMEHVGYQQDIIHNTAHTSAFNHSIGTQKGSSGPVAGVSEEFHLYAVEWLPDKIRFFTDDVEMFVFEPSAFTTAPTYKQWPFDKRFHLLMNIAVGGSWGGAGGFADDYMPVTMEVDYVRVYQSPEITALTDNN